MRKGSAHLIIILGVAVAVIGGLMYYALAGNKKNEQAVTISTAIESPSKTTADDPYAGWKDFDDRSNCIGFTFKYPANWSVDQTQGPNYSTDEAKCVSLELTSPSGNKLTWVNTFFGDGPGCDFGEVNECPEVATVTSEPISIANTKLVKQVICSQPSFVNCDGVIAIGTPQKYDEKQNLEVGKIRTFPVISFNKFSAFFMTSAQNTSIANPPQLEYKTTRSQAEEWLKSEDVKQVERIAKSIKKK